MRAITQCPSCQTQFIVTQEQLNQHHSKVRCGSCLKVFDATQHMLAPASPIAASDLTTENLATTINAYNIPASEEPLTLDSQDRYFNIPPAKTRSTFSNWSLWIFSLILLIAAIAQSLYFLRTEIAIYYPNTKSYLLQACEKIGCRLELPKKIDLIVIEDSDLQEDTSYVGLIHLSSTLINQADFSQAYPKIELTLTDIEDTPKLRRIFKPSEYLPVHAGIAKGIAAGEEVKVKLAITTQGEPVAGYRVSVHY